MKELIENKAKEHLYLNNFGDALEFIEKDVLQAMIQFATEMCELQKQECADKAELDLIYEYKKCEISQSSILNCKNVCTT